MKEELAKLIDLQKSDTKIRQLKQAIETASERRASLEQEFEQHASSIREIQKRRDDLTAERAANENQIAENKTYLERADRNLKHSQNQKEYETAMREIDALNKQVTALETKVVELLGSIEEVEKELETRAEEINTLDAKRSEAMAAFDLEVAGNQADLENESAKRKVVFDTLPSQLASVYDRLAQRSRDGIAVAEVVNGSCTACNMSLRPQMNVEVKKSDKIITCENCSRILYIASREAEATAS
ncbi:MAG: hypothetical protein KIT61_09510 [Pyrinomonadaceae bacterium]|nr:hypothetical protein [Blastocatellia bacterium]MCW5956811.1 hypothetical protein [Pyrinomonadaceae bacterium]